MSAVAEDRNERWEPFGVTESDFAAAPERDGVRVVNVTPGGGGDKDPGRHWLRVAIIALGALAAAAAAVSWQAQYNMVLGVKHRTWVAVLEAGIPDAGAIVFASLGIALALYGKRAVRTRVLNVVCVGISLMQNALAASPGWRDLAIWVMPSAVYAVASDTLIGVVRAWAMARVHQLGETLADDGPTPLAIAGGAALWLLRLTLAPRSTLGGFRSWVVTDCPVAPGLRPGHVAELEAVRQEAGQLAAFVTAERDEAIARAADEASQAREEAARAEAAEAAIRAELERTRSDAVERAGQMRADVARQREEVSARVREQAEEMRAEIRQVRDDAARLAAEFTAASETRIKDLDDARSELLAVSGKLAAALKNVARFQDSTPPSPKARGSRAGQPTKREQMIELASQRQDLETIPLQDVSKLASSVAGEIGYSQGTARRELMRHVRQLQDAGTHPESHDEGGQVS